MSPTLNAFLSGVAVTNSIWTIVLLWLNRKKFFGKLPAPAAPLPSEHPIKTLIDQLKKNGVPFEIIRDPRSPEICNCPVCKAARGEESEGGPSGSPRTFH